MKETIQKRGLPGTLCGVFYGCLCIFSLVMGLYYWIFAPDLSMIELSRNMTDRLSSVFSAPLTTVFGILTFSVGILQGLASYAILKATKKSLYRYAVGFTVFSLLSCSSKLLMSVNAFSIVKIVCYTAILVILLATKIRKAYR